MQGNGVKLGIMVLMFCCVFLFSLLGPQNSVAAEGEKSREEQAINVPARLEHIAFTFDKEGQYLLTLGLPTQGKSIAELEHSLRNDFAGTIEVYRMGKLYKVISYLDFVNFGYSQLGDSYGPTYRLDIDVAGQKYWNFVFVPHIKSKKECSYIFAIHRDTSHETNLISTRISSLFSKKERQEEVGTPIEVSPNCPENTDNSALQATTNAYWECVRRSIPTNDKAIQVRTNIYRVDIDNEREGRYVFHIGFQIGKKNPFDFRTQPSKYLYTENKYLFEDYNGKTEVYKNGKLYRTIDYITDRANITGTSPGFGYGVFLYWLDNLEKGTYSFIPQMRAKKECGFLLEIDRVHFTK